jgi:hypothetical protein
MSSFIVVVVIDFAIPSLVKYDIRRSGLFCCKTTAASDVKWRAASK